MRPSGPSTVPAKTAPWCSDRRRFHVPVADRPHEAADKGREGALPRPVLGLGCPGSPIGCQGRPKGPQSAEMLPCEPTLYSLMLSRAEFGTTRSRKAISTLSRRSRRCCPSAVSPALYNQPRRSPGRERHVPVLASFFLLLGAAQG